MILSLVIAVALVGVSWLLVSGLSLPVAVFALVIALLALEVQRGFAIVAARLAAGRFWRLLLVHAVNAAMLLQVSAIGAILLMVLKGWLGYTFSAPAGDPSNGPMVLYLGMHAAVVVYGLVWIVRLGKGDLSVGRRVTACIIGTAAGLLGLFVTLLLVQVYG